MDKDVFIKQSTLTSIADSIRAKTGKTEKIDPLYMPDEISTISGGGGGGVNPAVIDGTLAVITAEDLAGVTRIRDYAFYYCKSLKDVTIPDSVTEIGLEAFCNCTSLISATIPDSVTSIGNGAFYHCESLTDVTIPDSVTSISDAVFYQCYSLTALTIPDSVTYIGGINAFNSCTSLTEIINEGDTLKTLRDTSVFRNTPIAKGTGYIYIKPTSPDVDEAALVEAYKIATNWSVYADQIRPYSEYSVS